MTDPPINNDFTGISEADRKIHTLETMLDFSVVLNSAKELKTVFDAIMHTCMGEKGISVTSIILKDKKDQEIYSIRAVKGVGLPKDKRIIKFSPRLDNIINKKGYAEIADLSGSESNQTLDVLELLSSRIIIPVYFHGRIIAHFLCGPKISGPDAAYSNDDLEFLKLIASYSGIAISNLMGIDQLSSKKDDLERKLFELEAIEETRRSLTSSLNLETLCHSLLLSLMGYLKAENGCFYISIKNSDELSLMACTAKEAESLIPGSLLINPESFDSIAENGYIRREHESIKGLPGILDIVNSSVCFPLKHDDTFKALCFIGPRAVGTSFYRQSELEHAVMIARQAIAPIRNSILHLDLQESNKILMDAEQKARHNEARLSNILETANEGFVEIDFSGKIMHVNQEICRIIGLPKEAIVNRNIEIFLTEPSKSIVMEQLSLRRKGDKGKYELSVTSSSGSSVHCLISAAPIFDNPDKTDEPTASFAMITDISRLKETEDRLKEFAKIVSASNDMIALVDRNQMHKTVNRAYAKALGINDENQCGIRIEEAFGFDQYRSFIEPSIKRCLDGKSVHFRNWIFLPETGSRYLDAAFYPYFENSEAPSAVIIIMRDVTEVRILETNLQQSQKMEAIGALAGGIAHDFNNILSGILGYISLAEMFSEGQTREYLKKAQGSCQRAADLIKQILTFARKNEEEMKPFALSPIVQETMRLLRASIPATISIKTEIETSSKQINGNPTQIHQVILNLCTNAVHAMEEKGGILEISLRTSDWQDLQEKPPGLNHCAYFLLTVKDNGEGMNEEIIDRIFEPFFTTKKAGKGTGLGLSMSHGIIKSHGGEITVESSPGKGSKFSVYLPVTQISDEMNKKDIPFQTMTGNERILYIDDEESIVEISVLLLESLGYKVISFTDPVEALSEFERSPQDYDMIITDHTMPGLTGLELASKANRIRPGIPIIICSGYSEQLTPEKLQTAGISSYIVKPLTQARFSETIRSIFDHNRR